MIGAVQGWMDELEELHGRIVHRFARSEPRRRTLSYLKGLASSLERKNGWQIAEAAGESRPLQKSSRRKPARGETTFLAGYAVPVSSGHNTQPGLFEISGDTM